MNQCRSHEAPSNKQFQVKKLKGTLFTCCFSACFVTFEQKGSSKCSLRQFPGWTSCSQQSNRSYFDSSKRVPQNGIKWQHSNGNVSSTIRFSLDRLLANKPRQLFRTKSPDFSPLHHHPTAAGWNKLAKFPHIPPSCASCPRPDCWLKAEHQLLQFERCDRPRYGF